MQAAKLRSGADIRLARGIQAAHGGAAARGPRPILPGRLSHKHRVGRSVFDIVPGRAPIVAEDPGSRVTDWQPRCVFSDAGYADIGAEALRHRLAWTSRTAL